MAEQRIALVLAGGGARGAYELGALSALLPELARKLGFDERWRPDILVGTSVGAINTAFLASSADDRPLVSALEEGCQVWREMSWEKALAPLLRTSALGVLRLPFGSTWSLLDSAPLGRTLRDGPLSTSVPYLPFSRIHENVRAGRIGTAAVVATLSSTSLSTVFCDSSLGKLPDEDQRRGIKYVRAELEAEHVLASAAIPAAFPAVQVGRPWYFDGGTRLNTPIKPALDLGATHLIIVALNCPHLARSPSDDRRPEALDGALQLTQGLLVDPLVNDLHTLADTNEIMSTLAGVASQDRLDFRFRTAKTKTTKEKEFKVVPYIAVAPHAPLALGKIASDVFREKYGRRWEFWRRLDNVGFLGDRLGAADDPVRGELLSYLFFDGDFADELIKQGEDDAGKWFKDTSHDLAPWRTISL